MSVRIMSMVFQGNMPELKTDDGKTVSDSSAKFVLLALADSANDEGEGSYNGVVKLCQKTNLSKPTVCNALNALRTNGFIALIGRSKWNTNNYTLSIDMIDKVKWLYSGESSGFTFESKVTLPNPLVKPLVKPITRPEKAPVVSDWTGLPIEEKKPVDHTGSRARIEASIEKSMYAPGNVCDDYPEGLRSALMEFVRLWHIEPPGKKSRQASYWIIGTRSLVEAMGEFKLEIIQEYYDEYIANKPYNVTTPDSIVASMRAFAGKKRAGSVMVWPGGLIGV